MRNSMRSSVPARGKPHTATLLASSRPESAMSDTVIDLTLSDDVGALLSDE